MPDPDPAKDQDPTQPEATNQDAPDGTELTDEQLEKAAGGGPLGTDGIPPHTNPETGMATSPAQITAGGGPLQTD